MLFKFFPLLIFPVLSYSQTCVIAKISKNAVYIGADTRVLSFIKRGGYKDLDTVASFGCKIFSTNKVSFATIGLLYDDQISFAKIACDSFSSPMTLLENYGESFGKNLFYKLKAIRDKSLSDYQNIIPIADTIPISCTIFVCFDDKGKPFLGIDQFYAKRFALGDLFFSATMGYDTSLIMRGHTGEIDSLGKTTKIWQNGVPAGIEELIKIEAKAHRAEVGGPIDILLIEKDRIKWIKKSGYCN